MTSNETIASEVLAASLGGMISASALYPLEILKTKMQAAQDDEEKKETKKGMWQYAKYLYEKEGSLGIFFRGVEISALQSALEKALYFLAYTSLKETHRKLHSPQQSQQHLTASAHHIDTITNLALGCLAEWAHLPITLPVDAWTTQIQTQSNKSRFKQQKPLAILLHLLSGDKKQLYKGIGAYYVLCFKPALQYTVYEQVKQIILKRSHKTSLSAVEAFVLGMFARTISTVLVFPFVRAKVLLQTSGKTNSANPDALTQRNVTSVLHQVYQEQGLSGLFQGLGPELTRGIFSSALMLMIKERLAVVVREALGGERA